LECHDRDRFEVFCYSDVRQPDATTSRLRAIGHAWRETAALSDEALDRLIRDDRIDILVDLRGHAAGNRMMLFARKPAPVQATMIGYFDTTGLPTMNWRVTDAWMDPPGETEQFHTGRLARLPESCWCYRPDDDAPEVMEPPVVRKGYVTFGSLNKLIKVTEPCARLWAAVMEDVPRSRLVLSAPTDMWTATRERLARWGIPADRIDFLDKVRERADYLRRFSDIDIALDTFPFNGITTTCDGLWMGVPAVSLSGGTSVSRAGRSILSGVGLGRQAASDATGFVAAAAALALDPDRLREVRRGLRQRMAASVLTNRALFTERLEAAYHEAWRGG
jgi:predicted O-linked N-acetylglucosamine transferase (SPINDLY family)